MLRPITDYFSITVSDRTENHTSNVISVLPFHQITNDQLIAHINGDKNTTHMPTSIQDKINELDKLIFDPDRDDGSILSDIDPDINILFNMNDTIQNSSKYMDNSLFRTTFKMYRNNFLILNANIRGMVTNFNKLKLLIDDLDYTFPIISITEKLAEDTYCKLF